MMTTSRVSLMEFVVSVRWLSLGFDAMGRSGDDSTGAESPVIVFIHAALQGPLFHGSIFDRVLGKLIFITLSGRYFFTAEGLAGFAVFGLDSLNFDNSSGTITLTPSSRR